MMVDDSTRTRLLEAAGAEFAELGYAQATVRGILKRAGMSNVAAIHYYFGDKEKLYTEAVLDAHRHGGPEIEGGDESGGPAKRRLRGFIHEFLTKALSRDGANTWRDRLMMREMMEPTIATDALVRVVIRHRFGRLRAILKELAPCVDDKRLSALCFSVVGQCLFYRVGRPFAERLIGADQFAGLDLEYLSDHITNVVLAAVRAANARHEEGPCPGSR